MGGRKKAFFLGLLCLVAAPLVAWVIIVAVPEILHQAFPDCAGHIGNEQTECAPVPHPAWLVPFAWVFALWPVVFFWGLLFLDILTSPFRHRAPRYQVYEPDYQDAVDAAQHEAGRQMSAYQRAEVEAAQAFVDALEREQRGQQRRT